jgi:hypothetical protein
VSFHEYGFNTKLNSENQFGPWFMLSDKQRQQLGNPMGPSNPQALNRYSYVQNNPVRYTDPSGHAVSMTADQANRFRHEVLIPLINDLKMLMSIQTVAMVTGGAAVAAIVGAIGAAIASAASAAGIIVGSAVAGALLGFLDPLNLGDSIDALETLDSLLAQVLGIPGIAPDAVITLTLGRSISYFRDGRIVEKFWLNASVNGKPYSGREVSRRAVEILLPSLGAPLPVVGS